MAETDTTDAKVNIEKLEEFKPGDLDNLCDAADAAIKAGGGFGWLRPPERDIMERYWRGVLLVPGRNLYVTRLDEVIAGSAQLVEPPRNNEAQAHSATVASIFIAPWARGHGLARGLMEKISADAATKGYKMLNLDVRETQGPAIKLYEQLGFKKWGENPYYAYVDDKPVKGFFFYKKLDK